jgi:hypothetical protein
VIALDAFYTSVRCAIAGCGLRMGLDRFCAVPIVLFDSTWSGQADWDVSQESDGGWDGGEGGGEGGGANEGLGSTGWGGTPRAHSLGLISSSRIVKMGIAICPGSNVEVEVDIVKKMVNEGEIYLLSMLWYCSEVGGRVWGQWANLWEC